MAGKQPIVEESGEDDCHKKRSASSPNIALKDAWRWQYNGEPPWWMQYHHSRTEFEGSDLPGISTIGPHPRLQSYDYTPLPPRHIRLLVLCPEIASKDGLYGSFECASLDAKTSYKALSYTWGPPIFSETLHLHNGILKITPSLAGALRRFRHYSKYIRIWADAVCIDQSDVQERNHQVAMMADIYRNAQLVLIWLGDSAAEDARRFALLWFLAACYQETIDTGSAFFRAESLPEAFLALSSEYEKAFNGDDPLCNTTGCICCGEPLQGPPRTSTFAESLLDLLPLFTRSWWTRLWVYQESNLADRAFIFCGSHFLHQSLFYGAAEVVYECMYRGNPMLLSKATAPLWADLESACLQVFRMLDGFGQALLRTLQSSDRSSAAKLAMLVTGSTELSYRDPHDRIFGLIGMLPGSGLDTDYKMPMELLWRKVTIKVLIDPQCWVYDPTDDFKNSWPGLFIAIGAAQNHSGHQERMSWVADLSQSSVNIAKLRERYRMASELYAGGYMVLRHTPKIVVDSEFLCMRGKIVSSVDRILASSQWSGSPKPWDKAFSDHVVDDLLPWYSRCLSFLEQRSTAFSTTELRDVLQQGFILRLEDRLSLDEFTDLCSRAEDQVHFLSSSQISEAYFQLDAMLEQSFWKRDQIDQSRLLDIDNEGRVCWIPENSEPGGTIALLEGTPFPWIVRRRADKGNCFELLGDAYVHGIMRGEQWPLSPFFAPPSHEADKLEEQLLIGSKNVNSMTSIAPRYHEPSQHASSSTAASSNVNQLGLNTAESGIPVQANPKSRSDKRKQRLLQFSRSFERLDRKRWHMLEEMHLV